jgi:hypothetical protein
MYTPSGNEPSAATAPTPPITKLQTALKQVGPWLAFHFVFLVSAFLTMLLLWGSQPSILAVIVSLFLLGGAVFFSVLHMISRVYS